MMRRKHERRKVQVTALIRDPKGRVVTFKNRDISYGGIFLISPNPQEFPYAVGDSIDMNLQFYSSQRLVGCKGRVARMTRGTSVEAQMHKPGIGIEFVEVEGEGKKVFKSMLK